MASDILVTTRPSGYVSGGAQNAGNIGFMGQAAGGSYNTLYPLTSHGAMPFTSGDLYEQIFDAFSLSIVPSRVDACRPLSDVAGSVGDPVPHGDNGGSATAATGGTPTSDREYIIEATEDGDCGTVLLHTSEDNGVTWGSPWACAASGVANTLANGATVTFTLGAGDDFKEGDRWYILTVGPGTSNANLLAALYKYQEVQDITAIFVSEDCDAALQASYETALNTWATSYNTFTMVWTDILSWPGYFRDNMAATLTGTGTATAALTGEPFAEVSVQFKALGTGALGVIQLQKSIDGGVTWGTAFTSPASTVSLWIEELSMEITWTTAGGNDFVLNDVWTVGNTWAQYQAWRIATFGSLSDYRQVLQYAELSTPAQSSAAPQRSAMGKVAAGWAYVWGQKNKRHESAANIIVGSDLNAGNIMPAWSHDIREDDESARCMGLRDHGQDGIFVGNSVTLGTAGGDWTRVPYVVLLQAAQRLAVAVMRQWIERAAGASELGLLKKQLQTVLHKNLVDTNECDAISVELDLDQDVEDGVDAEIGIELKGIILSAAVGVSRVRS